MTVAACSAVGVGVARMSPMPPRHPQRGSRNRALCLLKDPSQSTVVGYWLPHKPSPWSAVFEETLCSFQVSILSARVGAETEALFSLSSFSFWIFKNNWLVHSGSVPELGSQAGVQGQELGFSCPLLLGAPGRSGPRKTGGMARTLKPCPWDRLRLRRQPCEVRLESTDRVMGVSNPGCSSPKLADSSVPPFSSGPQFC